MDEPHNELEISMFLLVQDQFRAAEIAQLAQRHEKQWGDCPKVLICTQSLGAEERRRAKDLGIHFVFHSEDIPLEMGNLIHSLSHFQMKNRHLGEMLLLTRTLNDELEKLSHSDNLTGLPNRRRFEDVFELEWRRATRERHSLAICMLDVDHFKPYNDTLGHQAGDQCLQQVAGCLQACFRRPGDMIARYGGEEFVGLLAHTDKRGAHIVFEWLRKRVEDLQIPHPTRPVVTISLGFCVGIPGAKSSPEDMIKNADDALYVAKQEGRNRVRQHRNSSRSARFAEPFQLQRPQ